jgi:UDP-GlcNAc:undecaprenyl-phosphate GlcNAc-1-phosphate transferase
MPSSEYILALIVSFLSCVIFTPVVIFIAQKLHILDIPNTERKIHKRPIPLIGGVAIFLSFNLVMLTYAFFTKDLTGDTIFLKNIIGLSLGTLILAVGGILDDKFNFKAKYQILFPVGAVVTVILCGIGIDSITNPLGSEVLRLDNLQFILFWYEGFPYKLTLFADLFTFIWLLSMMYTTKLLDGLDGLVSGITVIGAIFIFLTALNHNDLIQYDVALLSIILVGAFFGFLLFNFNPASIFLGEGGSTMSGFLLGSISIISGSKVGITLMLMSIPALDLVWTIIRRLMEKKSPFATSDRKHLHHRLLDAGFSVKQSVLFLYAITVIFGILAYSVQDYGISLLTASAVVLCVFMLILAYLYKRKLEREKALT